MKYLAFIPLLLIVTLIFLPHQSDAKPNQVIEDIRALAESELDAQLKEAQFEQAPDYISIRAYKFERILEVWAGLSDSEPLRLLKRYEICAMDFKPGTKLQEGDERTPEGSFDLSFYSSSNNWFMHISLIPSFVNEPGNVKEDPAFYVCTDYPTSFDKALAKSIGIKKPGSAICMHGNCVSAGCASMHNRDFIEIYYWLNQHNIKKYGNPRMHILPFKFYVPCQDTSDASEVSLCMTKTYKLINQFSFIASYRSHNAITLGSAKIKALWNHIGSREKQFVEIPTPQNAELEMSMDILKTVK